MNTSMSYLEDLLNLIYPNCCAACGTVLSGQEEAICLSCQIELPRAGMCDQPDNAIEKIFWMRADIRAATAFLRLRPHGMVHRLIHELKYHNNPSVGKRLGKLFAAELLGSSRMKDFDIVMPVPLHVKKQRQRGYNQCHLIAEGMNEILNREVSMDNLLRVRYSETQTKRGGRWNRWENVREIFTVRQPEKLVNKRILLLDDVITTGATIEACAAHLNRIEGVELMVGALAYAAK